jgi:TonB family protein
MKRAPVILFLLAATLPTAEVSGQWTGFMRPSSGPAVPLTLTLHEQGQQLSGAIAFDTGERQMPIDKAELRGDRLTFQAPDRVNHMVAFQLTATPRSLIGEATSEGQTLQVSLYPATRSSPYRVGGGVSAPMLIYKVEPEYTEEARAAKLQGTVLLYTEINPEGWATNMKVLRALGMGLDEKALESVAKWRFKPGMKDGQPVTVQAQIEVNFRL